MADVSPDKTSSPSGNRQPATSAGIQDEILFTAKPDLSEKTRHLLSQRYDILDKLGSGGNLRSRTTTLLWSGSGMSCDWHAGSPTVTFAAFMISIQ